MGLEVHSAHGCYIEDTEGHRYLDLISGISVASLGHGNEKVVEAVRHQAGRYMHTMVYGEHVQTPQVHLAERLISLLGPGFETVYFVNSGSEAIEAAIKLAKRRTGRFHIGSFRQSYHGSTHAAMAAMHDAYYTDAFAPLVPGFVPLDYNNFDCLERIDHRCAAVLIEPLQAEAGCRTPVPGFLQALRDRCTEVGALLVFDEIQTGMGRTGSLFAFQREAVVPDLIVLAKALGAGMPLGAVAGSEEGFSVLKDRPVLGHITTFGGHPVSCAAALAGLEVLMESNWISEVADKEARFRERLSSIPGVSGINGRGLMLAIGLESPERVLRVVASARSKGVLVDWFLHQPSALRIAPPLPISEDEIEGACALLSAALAETT